MDFKKILRARAHKKERRQKKTKSNRVSYQPDSIQAIPVLAHVPKIYYRTVGFHSLPKNRCWVVVGNYAEAVSSYFRKFGVYPKTIYCLEAETRIEWWMVKRKVEKERSASTQQIQVQQDSPQVKQLKKSKFTF